MFNKIGTRLKEYFQSLNKKPGERPVFALALVFSALSEIVLLKLFFGGFISGVSLGLLHLLVFGVLMASVIQSRRWGHELKGPYLLAITTLTLGPVGPAGTIFCLLLNQIYCHSSLSFNEWYESLFPKNEISKSIEIYRQVEASVMDLEHGDIPIPFIDVMSVGSIKQKQRVIALIAADFKPAYARTLLLALRDETNAIRVQAATTMARIENRFLEKTLKMNEELEADPNNLQLLYDLAKHYDDYAYTGILDPTRELENRIKALEKYHKILETQPENEAVHVAIARILIRNNEYRKASEWIRKSVQSGVSSPTLILWLAESEFHSGEWGRTREIIRNNQKLLLSRELPDRIRDCLLLWIGQDQIVGEESHAS